jgi:hypothetical protein
MNLKKKVKIALGNLHIIWSFHIPDILVFIALILTVIVSGRDFFENKNFMTTLMIYLTGIGISVAISQTVFTYAQCNAEDKNELMRTGQLFLYASMSLIMALFISLLSFKVKDLMEPIPLYVKIISLVLFSSNIMFFIFSVNSFHTGLQRLEKHLYFKVREDIK